MSATGEGCRAPTGRRPLVYATAQALGQAEALGFDGVLESAIERAMLDGRAYRRRKGRVDDPSTWLVDLAGGVLAVAVMSGVTPQGAQRWRTVAVLDRDGVNPSDRSATR